MRAVRGVLPAGERAEANHKGHKGEFTTKDTKDTKGTKGIRKKVQGRSGLEVFPLVQGYGAAEDGLHLAEQHA